MILKDLAGVRRETAMDSRRVRRVLVPSDVLVSGGGMCPFVLPNQSGLVAPWFLITVEPPMHAKDCNQLTNPAFQVPLSLLSGLRNGSGGFRSHPPLPFIPGI